MNFEKSRTKAILATFLVLTFAATLVALPTANAHTPPLTYPSFAYIALSPNPVGVGQPVYVVSWVSPNPPTAMGYAGDVWRNMKVTVTKPNGDTETLGPWNSDATGSTFTSYSPDQVGTYKFVLNYPGQVMSQTGPTGLTANLADLQSRGADVYINDTYQSSSATEYLTVQQEPIARIPDTPLPTEYWMHPIHGENSAWVSVASNWLAGSQIGGRGNVWQVGAGPNSPHIMWTKPIETGGIVGNLTTWGVSSYAIPDVGYYSGGSYEGRFTNAMIIDGRLYYADPLGHSNTGGGYTSVDLRTGQVQWHSDNIAITQGNTSAGAPNTILVPSFGQLFNYESQNQHGVVGGMLWTVTTVGLGATANITWSAYDAWTGKWLYNETGVPPSYTVSPITQSVQDITTDTGAIVRYVLNYNRTARNGWLGLWNNTLHNVGLELVDPEGGAGTNAYQWRPNGKSVDMSKAYSWNVTISADLSGLAFPSIIRAIPGDMILGASTTFNARMGTPDPYTIWAISDKPATRGQLMWVKNYSAPSGGVSRTFSGSSPVDTVNRVFFMQDTETMSWSGYSLDTGALLWGPVRGATRAYSYYGSGLGGGQQGFAAYGNLYTQGFGGELCCFSGKTGTLLWKFNNTNSGIETIWGYYPIFIAAICDGKVYAFDNEHSPNYPLYKGEKIYCLNATTGELIYSMLSWAGQSGGSGDSTSILADGYLSYYNYYDNQIYCVGKGPSATAVTASPKVSVFGDSVLIEGAVTDISAGTEKSQQAARFPNGVPAVSDASMSAWMEYVYMQQPYPPSATGVTVTLDVIDSNGNYRGIGTATTDTSGTFSYMWKPDIPGKYTLIATFQGSESYYASYAQTAFGVTEAPTASPTPTPLVLPPYETYTIGAAVAVIIAIAIAVVLILRKK
jgi:hypothetical protein